MPADSLFIDIVLVVVFAIIGVFIATKGDTSTPRGIIFLIIGVIFLLIALFIGLVIVGLA